MKTLRSTIIFTFLCLPLFLFSQEVSLIDYYPSEGETGAWDIAQFPSGDYLVMGFFQDDITIGGNLYAHTDNIDFFISKYSATDQLLWVKSFVGQGIQRGQDLIVDEDNNFYLATSFTEYLSIDTDTIFSNGNADLAIVKFDADGDALWTKPFGGGGSDFCYGLHYSGNQLWATGHFSETMEVDGNTLVSNGSFDQFALKMNATTGDVEWAKGFGGSGLDRCYAIHPASDGSLWMVGYYSEAWTFGATNLPAASNIDGFAGKLDANGDPIFAIPFPCTGNSGQIRYVEIDEDDQVYLSGFMAGTYTLFGETYEPGNVTNLEGILVAINQAGDLNWLKHTVSDYASAGAGVYFLDDRLFHTFYGGEEVDLYGDFSFIGGGFTDCAILELNPENGAVLHVNHMPNNGEAYITNIVGDVNRMRTIIIFAESLEVDGQLVGSGPTDDLAVIAYKPEGASALSSLEPMLPRISLTYEAGILYAWGLDGLKAERASMYTMEGQLLKAGTLSNHQWMVGSMPAGSYLVQIETERGVLSQLVQIVK